LEFKRILQSFNDHVDTIHLYNFYDHFELPDPEEYLSIGNSINISATKLNEEVVNLCHSRGMKVGVWVDVTTFIENAKFYKTILKIGVDFLVTDYPLIAMELRNKWIT
jgi:glycerophosphoryl diester phosphodiesterase